jgi:hypothetical protein
VSKTKTKSITSPVSLLKKSVKKDSSTLFAVNNHIGVGVVSNDDVSISSLEAEALELVRKNEIKLAPETTDQKICAAESGTSTNSHLMPRHEHLRVNSPVALHIAVSKRFMYADPSSRIPPISTGERQDHTQPAVQGYLSENGDSSSACGVKISRINRESATSPSALSMFPSAKIPTMHRLAAVPQIRSTLEVTVGQPPSIAPDAVSELQINHYLKRQAIGAYEEVKACVNNLDQPPFSSSSCIVPESNPEIKLVEVGGTLPHDVTTRVDAGTYGNKAPGHTLAVAENPPNLAPFVMHNPQQDVRVLTKYHEPAAAYTRGGNNVTFAAVTDVNIISCSAEVSSGSSVPQSIRQRRAHAAQIRDAVISPLAALAAPSIKAGLGSVVSSESLNEDEKLPVTGNVPSSRAADEQVATSLIPSANSATGSQSQKNRLAFKSIISAASTSELVRSEPLKPGSLAAVAGVHDSRSQAQASSSSNLLTELRARLRGETDYNAASLPDLPRDATSTMVGASLSDFGTVPRVHFRDDAMNDRNSTRVLQPTQLLAPVYDRTSEGAKLHDEASKNVKSMCTKPKFNSLAAVLELSGFENAGAIARAASGQLNRDGGLAAEVHAFFNRFV